MHPLSVTASVIAVVTAAKATSKGLRKIYKCGTASREIEVLIKELDIIVALLQETVKVIQNSGTESPKENILSQPVARLLYQIEEINGVLTPPRKQLLGLSEQRRAQLSWVKNEGKIKSLRSDLVDMKMDVLHALGIFTAYDHHRIKFLT